MRSGVKANPQQVSVEGRTGNPTRDALAKGANISTYKARQVLDVSSAADSGELPADTMEQVKAGLVTLNVKTAPEPEKLAGRERSFEPPEDPGLVSLAASPHSPFTGKTRTVNGNRFHGAS